MANNGGVNGSGTKFVEVNGIKYERVKEEPEKRYNDATSQVVSVHAGEVISKSSSTGDNNKGLLPTFPTVDLKINLDTDRIITDLKAVQREAKKATQAFREMENAQKVDKVLDDEVRTLLDLASRYGFVLTAATHDESRGIGKTRALVEKARAEGMFILVSMNSQVEYIKREFDFHYVISVTSYSTPRVSLPRAKYFLVDDLVTSDKIASFMEDTGKVLAGGFMVDSTTILLGNAKLKQQKENLR